MLFRCPNTPQTKVLLAAKKAESEAIMWQGAPVGGGNITHNQLNMCQEEPLGCANPQNLNKTTTYLDYAALASILGKTADCNIVEVQEPTISLNNPSKVQIYTSKSLTL